jgi:hypothetical protein
MAYTFQDRGPEVIERVCSHYGIHVSIYLSDTSLMPVLTTCYCYCY